MSEGLLFTRFYWGDYLRDTMSLSLAEHGAYIKLLAHYYSTGNPIPGDDRMVFRITGAVFPEEQDAAKLVLTQFFEHDDQANVYRHSRADKEFKRAREQSKKKSEAGRRGAAKRWQNDGSSNGKRIASAMEINGKCHDSANGKTMAYQRPDTRDHIPETRDKETEKKARRNFASLTDWFNRDFWPMYRNGVIGSGRSAVGKSKALEALKKLDPDEQLQATIIEHLTKKATIDKRVIASGEKPTFWKDAERWIKAEGWTDELAAAPKPKTEQFDMSYYEGYEKYLTGETE